MILIIAEVRVRDYGFSTARQEELWGRWRGGESQGGIARSMGAQLQHVRRFLLQTSGLKSPPRCRSLRHLAGEEREEISRGIAAGRSARAIARGLGRPASTVSREIARNGGREGCRAGAADAAAEVRARPKQAKLAGRPDLRVMVEELLGRRWSPQQISGRLRLDFPDDRAMWVSHETIYLALFDPRHRAINRQLSRRLRTGRRMRLPRKARQPSGRGRIRDMLPIGQRPPKSTTAKSMVTGKATWSWEPGPLPSPRSSSAPAAWSASSRSPTASRPTRSGPTSLTPPCRSRLTFAEH
jgi:hypothetical protein